MNNAAQIILWIENVLQMMNNVLIDDGYSLLSIYIFLFALSLIVGFLKLLTNSIISENAKVRGRDE